MASIITTSLFLAAFAIAFVAFAPHCIATNPKIDAGSDRVKRWCVAKPGAHDIELLRFIDNTCPNINCYMIRPGGACFEPNTVPNHASYVLNLVYQFTDKCDPTIGRIILTDPSYGRCQFPA